MLHSLVSTRLEDCVASALRCQVSLDLDNKSFCKGPEEHCRSCWGCVFMSFIKSHPELCLAGWLCRSKPCLCCGSGGWNEYFKDALKSIASKGVHKSRFNVKVKAG